MARITPYARSGQVQYITVMARGEIDMMSEAVNAMGDNGKIIAVTELTSLSEEQVHLGKLPHGNLRKNRIKNGMARLFLPWRMVQTNW